MQKTLLLVIGKQNAASPHLVAESWPGNGPRGELRAEACRTSPRRFRVADRGHNSRAAAAAAVDAADWPGCEQSARKRWRRRECYIGATGATTLILTKLAWHADWLSHGNGAITGLGLHTHQSTPLAAPWLARDVEAAYVPATRKAYFDVPESAVLTPPLPLTQPYTARAMRLVTSCVRKTASALDADAPMLSPLSRIPCCPGCRTSANADGFSRLKS